MGFTREDISTYFFILMIGLFLGTNLVAYKLLIVGITVGAFLILLLKKLESNNKLF